MTVDFLHRQAFPENGMDGGYRCWNVAAIVVTYNPDLDVLNRGLTAIARQVGFVVVVDNASQNLDIDWMESMPKTLGIDTSFISLPTNVGVGAGFNIGAREARSRGFSFITLFDQDSIPQEDMVQKLELAYKTLGEKDLRIAAVGPRFIDPESGSLSSFVRCGKISMKQVVCDNGTVQADFLISSGSYVFMRAFDEVGEMDETLFIDHVDTEWCLRAKSKGWSIYGVCDAIMEHSLGERRRQFWFFRWRNIAYHAPFRYYYIFRNTLILGRRGYVQPNWRRVLLTHIAMLTIYMIIIAPNRIKNLSMMQRGISDGIQGVCGQIPQEWR